jgi:hypothetical protein
MTGKGGSQRVVNARKRDYRFLVLRRKLSAARRGDLAFVLPPWLAESLGYDEGVSIQPEDGWREFLLLPEDDPDSRTVNVSIRTEGSATFRFGAPLSRDLHYEVGDHILLDVDMREPENGMLVTPDGPGGKHRFSDAPTRREVWEMMR